MQKRRRKKKIGGSAVSLRNEQREGHVTAPETEAGAGGEGGLEGAVVSVCRLHYKACLCI